MSEHDIAYLDMSDRDRRAISEQHFGVAAERPQRSARTRQVVVVVPIAYTTGINKVEYSLC